MKKYLGIITFVFLISIPQISTAQDHLIEDILGTWDKHVAMNKLLMSAVKFDFLKDTLASGGRNIADQFAHMHNVRMMWLNQLMAEKVDYLDNEVDAEESLKAGHLVTALKQSDQLVRTVLSTGLKNNIKSWPMSPVRFMSYLISHESHTRGQIILALKQSGHPAPPQVAFGIWEW